MTIKLCLVSKEDAINPVNLGSKYVISHKSAWIDATDFGGNFLTVGYMKGSDFIYYKNKTYLIKKSFIMPEDKTVVVLCEESVSGCDL